MKIVISDFVGTFYDPHFEENIYRVNQFVEKGNLFILATGQNIELLKQEFSSNFLNFSYLICNDGATIYDHNWQEIRRIEMEPEEVAKAFQMLDHSRVILETFLDHSGYYSTNPHTGTCTILGKAKNEGKALILKEQIERSCPHIHGYLGGEWLCFTDCKVTKAESAIFILEQLKIDLNQVYVVGDSINNLSLHEQFHGYALVNGDEKLKDISEGIVTNFLEFMDLIDSVEG